MLTVPFLKIILSLKHINVENLIPLMVLDYIDQTNKRKTDILQEIVRSQFVGSKFSVSLPSLRKEIQELSFTSDINVS